MISDNEMAAHLSTHGVRPTRQRLAIANALFKDEGRHIDATCLYVELGASATKVSLATVYNTLSAFCEVGLMQEVTVDGSKSYFDTNMTDHPHFYWEDTFELADAPADQLKISVLPNAPVGAEIAKVDVVIRLRRKS